MISEKQSEWIRESRRIAYLRRNPKDGFMRATVRMARCPDGFCDTVPEDPIKMYEMWKDAALFTQLLSLIRVPDTEMQELLLALVANTKMHTRVLRFFVNPFQFCTANGYGAAASAFGHEPVIKLLKAKYPLKLVIERLLASLNEK